MFKITTSERITRSRSSIAKMNSALVVISSILLISGEVVFEANAGEIINKKDFQFTVFVQSIVTNDTYSSREFKFDKKYENLGNPSY